MTTHYPQLTIRPCMLFLPSYFLLSLQFLPWLLSTHNLTCKNGDDEMLAFLPHSGGCQLVVWWYLRWWWLPQGEGLRLVRFRIICTTFSCRLFISSRWQVYILTDSSSIVSFHCFYLFYIIYIHLFNRLVQKTIFLSDWGLVCFSYRPTTSPAFPIHHSYLILFFDQVVL